VCGDEGWDFAVEGDMVGRMDVRSRISFAKTSCGL
jgi:hypothetical protein